MSVTLIYNEMAAHHGSAYAQRWLRTQHGRQTSPQEIANDPSWISHAVQESLYEHPSYVGATELLEPYRVALGAAYATLHLLARWSLEHATEHDPAPHLLTTYWTLEEAVGKKERTLRRHLVESGHPWSDTVAHLIDLRPCYGEMPYRGGEGTESRPVVIGTVIRFFPRGRQSEHARVKRWGRRDLSADADEGRTRPSRLLEPKRRYQRCPSQMSGYSSVKEQSRENNWLMIQLGQTVTYREEQAKDSGNLYADIPKNYVLHALREDLALALENAQNRGASLKRARTRWVDTAAKVLAVRFGDSQPGSRHEHTKHITHWDGFTDLWRRALWGAVKAELYGGTSRGWILLQQGLELVGEGKRLNVDKPSAWAWSQIREEMEALRRDFGSGMAGVVL